MNTFNFFFFFFQAEDGIRDIGVTGVQTCALPISGQAPYSGTERSGARGGMGCRSGVWRGGNKLGSRSGPPAGAGSLPRTAGAGSRGGDSASGVVSCAGWSAEHAPRAVLRPARPVADHQRGHRAVLGLLLGGPRIV